MCSPRRAPRSAVESANSAREGAVGVRDLARADGAVADVGEAAEVLRADVLRLRDALALRALRPRRAAAVRVALVTVLDAVAAADAECLLGGRGGLAHAARAVRVAAAHFLVSTQGMPMLLHCGPPQSTSVST